MIITQNIQKFKVNGNRDAMMDRTHPINEIVEFIKVCKSGLFLVKNKDGKEFSIPKFNLDEIS